MLEIDYSMWPPGALWLQVANFLILLLVLNIIVYRPIRNILSQRKNKEESFQEAAEGFKDKAAKYSKELAENIMTVRNEGNRQKTDLKNQGFEDEKVVLQDAVFFSEEKIARVKEEIQIKITDARQSLQSEVELFSQDLVEKILGKGA